MLGEVGGQRRDASLSWLSPEMSVPVKKQVPSGRFLCARHHASDIFPFFIPFILTTIVYEVDIMNIPISCSL